MATQTGILNRVVIDRRTELIKRNIQWLRQAHNLLQNIHDGTYTAGCPRVNMQSVSCHMEALLGLYECFLSGLGRGRIDYDTPGRQIHVREGATRRAAMDRIFAIISRLRSCAQSCAERTLSVRPMCTGRRQFLQQLMVSSPSRELDFLSGQAAHELALSVIMVQLTSAARESCSGARAA